VVTARGRKSANKKVAKELARPPRFGDILYSPREWNDLKEKTKLV